ncbi:MAG: preprotein translocase subunit YajC [Ruminococcus sp.]|nr:preprotein translocase subunit YajC [Ruminococcus sp.]MDY2743798.1 preprotein translocase subunit YajC [Eubacteriales bacterium]
MKLSKIFSALVCVAVVATMFLAVAVSADTGTTGTAQQEVSPLYQVLSLVIPFALLAVVFYFFIMRPQKKQQRETQQMRDSIARGDTVVTAGGIVGIVITVKDDMVLLESSGDKTKIQVQKWAISSILEKAE